MIWRSGIWRLSWELPPFLQTCTRKVKHQGKEKRLHMNEPIQLTNTIPPARNSLSSATAGPGFILIALAWLALSPAPKAFGVTPAPDGGYPNGNTAEGDFALNSLTTGDNNTANGIQALFSNTSGILNTATGASALSSNTTGGGNTANGFQALLSNTTGKRNIALGSSAGTNLTTGDNNIDI